MHVARSPVDKPFPSYVTVRNRRFYMRVYSVLTHLGKTVQLIPKIAAKVRLICNQVDETSGRPFSAQGVWLVGDSGMMKANVSYETHQRPVWWGLIEEMVELAGV